MKTSEDFNPRTPCGVRRNVESAKRRHQHISIHAPHAGCDRPCRKTDRCCAIFQSTHPMRGATSTFSQEQDTTADFNPRTPCGVRLRDAARAFHLTKDFNPRTPCGVRPLKTALRMRFVNFNPRTPCGVRQCRAGHQRRVPEFQSTHPMRGATARV